MADFGGFEIEDDEKRPSSPSAFGGFEIEDGDEGEPGETGSAASAEASTPKSPAPTSASPAPAPASETPPAPTWESGDGGDPTLPVGEKNQWGGNLRAEGRKPLIRRDANGKVNGYSTTSSMLVKHDDGRFAVVPTVVDGQELSPEDAVKHYSETGEHWGMADDEEGAKKIARAVHDEHQKAYQKGWNEYIHEHWDEMGDGIRNDRGVAYEHKKRTAPDSITGLERYANSDFDLPDGDVEKSRAVIQDFAKEAGLEPWQAERLLQSADKPYRLRSYMPWIAQQRMREIPRERERKQKELDARMQAIQDEKGKETGHLENVRNVFSNIGLGSLAGVYKVIGTALGGEVDVRNDRVEEVMVDHPLAKKDGETFDSWYERVQESFNPKKRMEGESKAEYGLRRNASARIKREAKKYFDWMAPVAGKEGMHKEQRVLRGVNPRLENGGTSIGNFFLDLGGHIQETIDEDYPVGRTGNVAVDWVSNAATGIGKFGMLNIAAIPVFANEAYLQTKTTALKSGKSVAEAESLGSTAGLVDGALTAAFYAAPFKRWFNSKGITPVQRVASGSFSDMSRGMGRYFAKREMLNVGVAALEAVGIMGVQGAADTAIAQLAQGQDVDLGEVTVGGLKGVRDGVLIGAVMGGARILNARIKGAKEYERIVREAIKTPEGRQALAEMNVEGMADFLEAFEKGGVADSAQADRAGLPKMSIQERGQFASRMKAQGVTSEMLRRGAADFRRRAAESFRQDPSNQLGARSGDGDIVDGHGDLSPKPPSPDAPPPSTDLASRIKSEFGTEPVGFNIPQTTDGKPKLTPMKWRENRTGKENTCNIAHDPNTGVTIMEEPDGSFSVYNDTGDSDGAASLDEAIEKANELALMGQYTQLDRKRKQQVIENERETKYGKKNVAYFNTMADAADAFENGIGREGSMFGLSDASQLRDPAVQDRDAFYTPDGTTVVILDNVQEVNDIPRILAHEIVGHGGPNGEFGGRTGAQVVFAENIRAKEFEAFKKEIVDGLRKEVRASDMDAVKRNLGEVFAHYAAANLDKEPSKLDKLVSAVNGAARKLKLRKTYSAADVRTMMARWRNAVKGEGGELFDLTDGSPRFEFFPVEERKPAEVKDEARNGADEAQPQPEQGAEEPAGAEAPRPAEAGAPGAEAPRTGVVATVDNLHDLLKGAAVELAENGGDPSNPGHRMKTATKEEIAAKQQEIVDALNDPDPQNFERFLDKMNSHACRIVEMQQFKEDWQRLHPEVDLNSTPRALANERNALELDIESAKEDLANHPNSESLKTKVKEAEKKLADFMAAHPDGALKKTQDGTTQPSKTDNGGQKLNAEAKKPKSVTAEQITAEQKKRAEKEAIKKRQEAPLKGSGAVNVQPEMDLGQTGQQDLFSPIAEKPAQKPAKTAPASAPNAEVTTPPKSADAPHGGKSAENAAPAVWPKGWEHGKSLDGYIRTTKADITALKPGDEVAVAHTSGGASGAKQAIFATVRSVGEEYDGAANADIFIGDYKDGVGYDQDARFKKSEIIGIRRKEGKSETPAKPAPVRENRTTENQDEANNLDEVRAAFEREHGVKFGADGFTPWTYPERGVAERYRVLDGPWGASVETERVDLKSVKADIKSAIGSNSAHRDEIAERTKAFLESGGDVDAFVKWKDAPDVAEDIVIRAAEKMGVGLTRGDARLPKQMDEILSEMKSIVSRRTTEKSSQVATSRQPSIKMEVSKPQADEVYGIIEAKAKEAANGPGEQQLGKSSRVDSNGGTTRSGDNGNGPDAGESAAGGDADAGGVLAGGRVRPENPDERVGSVGAGAVSGLGGGLAETQAAGEGASGAGGASEGAVPVADSAGHGKRERDAGGGSSGNGSGPAAGVKKPAEKSADLTKVNPIRRDFVMTNAVEDAIVEKRTADRVRNNIAAIKLIRDLAKRDYAATPAEQETLAKFVGWGGLREAVFSYDLERAYDAERSGDASMAKEILRRRNISQNLYDLHKELRSILNDKEYDSAKRSSSTAFYTPVGFVRALHDALRNLGVKGGRFLGPSAGTGNFASASGQYEKPVNWQFVEKDAMTGEILKALFPNQRVTIGGFEETKFPDGFFDFAIDNVPYADVPINDRSLSSKMFKIHDYFFAKTLAKLRPGGVMAFLTSTGTLDKTSPILRQFLTERGGRIVGAVRLPNGFFSENAGTEAASDLVIVQKVDGRPDNSAFEKGVEYGFTEQWERRKGMVKKPLTYNGYFKEHPEQIVGKMEATSGQYGPRLNYAMPDGDMMDAIRQAVARAFDGIDRDALLKNATVAEQKDSAPIYDESGLRQGNVTLKDGKPFVKSGEMLVPVAMPNDRRLKKELMKRGRTGKGILSDLFALRKAMRDLIDAQMADTDTTETDLAPLQKALGDAYDAFVKKNGTLHDRWVTPFVLLDKADGNRMLALERVVKGDDGKQKVVKSDIFTKRVISRGQRASRAETPKDALVISYSESGGINVPRIAELLGVDEETAIAKLKEGGDAFENPQTGRLEPSWEYLSGRVRAKLAAARAALEAGEEGFRANVEALEKVQPPMVKLEDTEIKFGATWVEPDVMSDFMRDAFGSDRMQVKFVKNEATGQWEIPRASGSVANDESPWGETSWDPLTFVLRVLNHGSMNHIVTDPVTKKKYLDERKTEANKLAAEKMHQAFAEFIMSSDKWAEPMYERYNAVMTDMVEIKLPNNVLPFRSSGMSESAMNKLFEGGDPAKPKKGREYQSAVIARGVLGGSSLCLAHCVGAGKTLEMQSIGMMGRRLGMFKKPMYVVPNHMLEQFVNEFVDAFPNANILKMSEDDVKPENRRAFFAQVANGDWDAIVVKRSTFSKKLAMSTEYQKNYLQSQIDDMAMVIEAMQSDGNGVSVNKANKIREKLQAKLEHLVNAENHDSEIVPFEELGIDQLFIDEAHNFKGLPIVTSQGRTGGLSQDDSQQAIDMQTKTEYVQSLHGGNRGVVFATGTPLSNAPVVESYVILKYLAPNRLKEQGLEHFDDFVGAFGRITTESEFSLNGRTVKERDKVSAFVNIPELMRLFKSVVDIVNPDQLDIPRPKPKYHMIDVDMTPTQARIMEMVADWASMPPDREDRNRYLDLTRIAKNACLTPRLIGFADGGNKVIRAVSEIKRVYDETSGNRGAQLVFTDMFNLSEKTSRNAFDRLNYLGFTDERPAPEMLPQGQDYNLNEEIRDLLVQAGIPKEEIAIIQDIDKSKGDKDANKSALFAKVRSGEVRVLIGSRPKMGEGTNVQERLAAIHLLHPGWKPAEDEQAIGRIIRFGNTYKEGQIFYYLTKGNSKVGSYETKNHQIVGVKGRLIDQVMHGDDTIRVIEMDENAMDRDMLMGLASGNKALMELIDVNKRVHKLELNTESTASSARRLKIKAEATERDLDRRVKEFEKTRKGIDRWNEANKDKPFEISTPDGRTIEKVGEIAQYVSAQVSKQLTKDAYDRDETVRLGEINGIPVVATFDAYDDQKVKIAVPTLGVEREINYSGFIPDFSTGAMTAFKKTILDIVDPSYAEEFDARIEDLRKQTKKMSADAAKLQKDFDAMSKELATLRSRQAQLEREVTPLVVQTVKDRKVAQYGNWFIEKSGGEYSAIREKDGKELRAATVKELIPLMDAEDFARPSMAATKTRDLTKHIKPDSKGNYPGTFEVPVEKVNFDTPELTPAEAEYAAGEDKTPTEKVMREVYGMTNDEIATALRAAGMEPPAHVRKSDEVKWQQAEALLSNPTYMAKLSRAVAKFPRPLRDYEIDALNVLFRERQNAVNAAQGEVDDWKQTLDSIADGEVGAAEKKEDARKNLAAAQSGLARAKALMVETGKAKIGGASEQGRGLRANRGSLYQDDLTYAGITGEIARIVGGAERVTPEMDAKIRDLAKLFEDLDEQGLRIATERLKPLAEKVIKQTKDGLKVRKATERKAGDEAKRVTRNYEDALNQIEVGAAEVGGTLIGLSDQQYPSWGRWLKAIGEFHCFENPNITEEEVVNAILDDISPFMDGVDANQVRDALTGFGHNFKQSRYDSQRLMNDLKSQARLKRQLDWMDENNTMPPLTGMVRDEPSDVTRNLQKQVAERKKEVPDAGRDERRLKGVLDSAKTRVRNRIADLQRAIETGERIPASQRKVVEDLELRELKRQKEELQKAYDELFKTERTMTDAQRIALAEKLLAKELERALEDLDRARAGDFSKRPKRPGVKSSTIDVLRDRIAQTREQIRELKKAKYEFGMTPEKVAALNARKMASRKKALARLAERVATGDTRTQKKPQPPMPPDMKKRYDELGEQMNRAHRKLADIRREAADARKPAFVRFVGSAYRFIDSMWKMATASLDFTQVGNQTGSILAAHPKLVAENFAKTLKAFSSQVHADSIDADLLSDPAVREAVDNKWLHWKKVSELSNSGERVEMFDVIDKPFTLFGKAIRFTDIPIYGKLIANSDRLYATYINAVSASLYSSIVNDPNLFPGGASAFQKKMLCDMINVMNGSGTISKGTRRVLGSVLWAPGLVDSQLKRMVGYQIWHPWLAESEEDGSGSFKERAKMSWIGAKEWARSNIGAILLGGLLFALFATDDQKDEFKRAGLLRKFQMVVAPRIRHTQLDFTGGSIAFMRLADRLVMGEYETSTGKTAKVRDVFGELSHFAKGRVTPLISNAFSLLSGRDYTGADFGLTELLLSLAPISISAAAKSIYENGIQDREWMTAIVASTLTMFGIGKGTYRKDDYKILTNRFLEANKEYEAVRYDAELEKAEKDAQLSDMRKKNRLMEDKARLEINARIGVVKKFESTIRKFEKAGNPVPQSVTDGLERAKAVVIGLIRKYRKDEDK